MGGIESSAHLLDYSQDKVAVLDVAGVFTYVNAAVERILGYDPASLTGECAFDYVHPEDVGAVRRAFERVVESDSPTEATAEYRHRAWDGSWVWLESRLSNPSDPPFDGYVVSSRDVTDRVRAEREHESTVANLADIAAASGDVLWLFDADWSELLFVNDAVEAVYGIAPDALEADPTQFLSAVHPEDVSTVESAMARLTGGEPVDIEYRVHPGEQYRRWVWVQGYPVFEDGAVARVAGFSRDVTDRKRRERQLVVLDNLLRHNLRNDLNVVMGLADSIEAVAPETADRTAVIRQTVSDLLSSAEKERDVIELLTEKRPPQPVALDVVVSAAVERVRERRPAADVEVTEMESVTVRARPELEAAVVELIYNAIDHSDTATPRVRVAVSRRGSVAEVSVSDASTPIPDMEAAVLTGDHDMTDLYHSSGLGLWLVYWTVALSGGEVAVETDADGNRVTLSLPLAPD